MVYRWHFYEKMDTCSWGQCPFKGHWPYLLKIAPRDYETVYDGEKENYNNIMHKERQYKLD